MSERFLSATFADLPAPDLPWEQMPSAPVPRLDGSAIQIKNLFYVLSGYGTLDYVRVYHFSTYISNIFGYSSPIREPACHQVFMLPNFESVKILWFWSLEF